MTQTEQPDLKPVIAAIYDELTALWELQGLVPPQMMEDVAAHRTRCLAVSRLFGPEREITHDELLAYYKAWDCTGGQ